MNSAEQLQKITQNIEKVQKHSPLAAKKVTVIAVSKSHPAQAIMPLIEAGHRVFGENRVQEAAEKWPALRGRYPDIELHLIGSLQSNKVKAALSLFDVIHTIDRSSLVDAIVQELKKSPARCKRFFVQVNTGEEPQKGGVSPKELPQLMDYIKEKAQGVFSVTGFMCVPPNDAVVAPHFALLHKLAREYGLEHLSMGMSGDYETAVRLGATYVRIGTALFGERRN